jgi:hypothetical protein
MWRFEDRLEPLTPASVQRLRGLRCSEAIERLGLDSDRHRVLSSVRDVTGEIVGRRRHQSDPARRDQIPKMRSEGTPRELCPPAERTAEGEVGKEFLRLVEAKPDGVHASPIGLAAAGTGFVAHAGDSPDRMESARRALATIAAECRS